MCPLLLLRRRGNQSDLPQNERIMLFLKAETGGLAHTPPVKWQLAVVYSRHASIRPCVSLPERTGDVSGACRGRTEALRTPSPQNGKELSLWGLHVDTRSVCLCEGDTNMETVCRRSAVMASPQQQHLSSEGTRGTGGTTPSFSARLTDLLSFLTTQLNNSPTPSGSAENECVRGSVPSAPTPPQQRQSPRRDADLQDKNEPNGLKTRRSVRAERSSGGVEDAVKPLGGAGVRVVHAALLGVRTA
ncbi:Hypothetical predicted protein [Xyrichtys novacula]|uniref:Uncharacterized protein n=1 Tax=Xyrichtys novacula TaxID=13765 RepID=A0AAV1G4V2_XYRNO|nr:Hypothetical predicted protein [Xyrichtys novacula]